MDINTYIYFLYISFLFLQKEDIFFCKNYMLWISNSHLGRSIYSATLKYLLEKVLYFNLYINMETRISSRGRGVCKYWFSEYSKSLNCIQICPKIIFTGYIHTWIFLYQLITYISLLNSYSFESLLFEDLLYCKNYSKLL